jgi:hypothetical protein
MSFLTLHDSWSGLNACSGPEGTVRLNDECGDEPISAAHPPTLQAPPLLLLVGRPLHRPAEAALTRGLGAPGRQPEGLGYV